MSGDGTKVGNAYVEVTPKAAGNFTSVLDSQMSKGGEGGGKFGSAFSEGMQGAISAGAVAVGTILADLAESGAELAKQMVGDAFTGFADYQQLTGGMDKLFGEESAKAVVANAQAAFETAGMSANEYMEKATSISSSLISSVGGDTEEAARLADVAIRAMSDNYNTFGTDAESVSNAFMGLAKQNYSMLDNLSLGYAGNQQGMLELINDSGVLGEKLTDTSQLADVGFGKMVEAIQEVQEQQGIAGTTFNEYKTTVTGSIDAMKASWSNWLTALGDPDADMGEMTDKLLETVGTALDNALPLLERIFGSISESLPGLVNTVVPVLVTTVTSIGATLFPAIISMTPGLLSAGMQLFGGLLQAAITMLPLVVQAVVGMAPSMLLGAGQMLITLVQAAVVVLPQVAQTVIAAGPGLLAAGMEFFNQLGYALGQVVPMLFDALVYVVTHLPEIVVNGVVGMIEAGANLVGGLVQGILGSEPESTRAGTDVASSTADAMLGSADASAAGESLMETFQSSFDFSGIETSAADAVQAATDAATASADGSSIAEQLAQTTTSGIDVTAMNTPSTEMVQNAVEAAKSVDATSVGAEFSQKAAGGIDVSAMASKMTEVTSMAGALNTSATVSVKADLSGVNQLRNAAGSIAGFYKTMASQVSASMAAASRSATTAASSVRSTVAALPNKTVYVNVARGSVSLPHFSMYGDFDPKTKAVPYVSVAWFADGAIFPADNPQIIGVGDAHVPEVVAPIDKLDDMLDKRGSGGQRPVMNVTINGVEGPDAVVRAVNRALDLWDY